LAGLTEVPAVIMKLTDEQAMEIALLENLQREDLNPLEETEGVINLLSAKLQISPSGIPALLHRLQEITRGRKKFPNNVVGESEQGEIIQQVFASLGLMEVDSFISHRLPLLNLPESILKALRSGQIAYTKALAIAKVKETQQQQKLLEEATKENLSLSQIRAKVSEFNQIKNEQVSENELTLKEKVERTYRRLRQSKALENPKKQKQLTGLLAKIEALLED
ncbi:MAG: ParB/RepB/Spo0J family partition protein, partial [Microcystaceae cyanobacterium]